LGLVEQMLRNWVPASKSGKLTGAGAKPVTPEQMELSRLIAENARKNRLTSAGGAVVTYDDEGQLASVGGTSYIFNYAHRLARVAGTATYDYSYDGKGNRLKVVNAGVVTKYIYDAAGNLLAEADANNTITRYYIQGLGLMAMIAPTGTVYTYHFNPVGSTVAMTDPSRAIVNKYAYAPFGGIIGQYETIPQPLKFVGQFGVMAEPNGLYYMRARYYDPKVGRFISEDPLSFGGGDVNLMAYAGNNPVNAVDPWGMDVFYHGEKVNNVVQAKLERLSEYTGYDIHVTSGIRNSDGDSTTSQHYTGNAADFYMTTQGGKNLDMGTAARLTAQSGEFNGIGYYDGNGNHGAHVHADARDGSPQYWSETDKTGYKYNGNSPFWSNQATQSIESVQIEKGR
jgi:RHS repeat-associated protein